MKEILKKSKQNSLFGRRCKRLLRVKVFAMAMVLFVGMLYAGAALSSDDGISKIGGTAIGLTMAAPLIFAVPKELNLSDADAKGLEALAKHFDDQLKQYQEGLFTSEELKSAFENYAKENGISKDVMDKFDGVLKKQGIEISKLKVNPYTDDALNEEFKAAFDFLNENKGKASSYSIKAAGPVFSSAVPSLLLRREVAPIQRLDADEPVIYDALLKGTTEAAIIDWANQKPKEGGAAFIGEGVLKPLMDWTYDPESTKYAKIAVRSKHSEEIFMDFDNFMSEVKLILTDSLTEKRDEKLLLGASVGDDPKGLTMNASPYIASGGIDGNVIAPNLADVIVTLALQVKTLGKGKADLAIVNAQDHAMMLLTKTDAGNYLTPELKALLSNIKIVESSDMPVGSVLVCDSRKHIVKNRRGIIMKTVYENDDMTKNLVGFVVEQFLFSYRSEIHDACVVYDKIDTVKASLLKV